MRLSLHTVICCCVFTTVLPPVKGATGESNTNLKKRFRVWLQGRLKRDVHNTLAAAGVHCQDMPAGPQQDGEGTLSPTSSTGLNIRSKRSTSTKVSGCFLITCLSHDLIDKMFQMRTKGNTEIKAPPEKIGSNGYGRRRRSLLDALPSIQRVKDGALKLDSEAADTTTHAQCPKIDMERQRQILVGILSSTADEEKSP